MVAARRTYADVVVNLIKQDAFPYHFADLQGRVDKKLGSNTTLAFTAYSGTDQAAGDSARAPHGGWGNSVVGGTLTRRFGAGLLGDSGSVVTRASWTRFWALADASVYRSHIDDDVTDIRTGTTLTARRGSATTSLGFELSHQLLRFASSVDFTNVGDLITSDSVEGRVNTLSAFVDETWKPTSRLLLDIGLRADAPDIASSAALSPRASAKFFVNSDLAVSAGLGRTTQWLHSLGRGEEPLQPFQFWVPIAKGTPLSSMRDANLGVERWLSPRQLLHIGTYYKRYDRLMVPNRLSDPLVTNDELVATSGTSYGLDFLWRKLEGEDFSGWISYSYALGIRTDASGFRYAPPQDRRHNINLVGSWRANQYTFGVRANFATGYPNTPVEGQYARDRYDPVTKRWISDGGYNQIISGAYESDRLPAYQRIDLSLTRDSRLFGLPMKPYVSILNVLNTSNPAAWLYSFDARSSRASFPNLPFVPTFGVTLAY